MFWLARQVANLVGVATPARVN